MTGTEDTARALSLRLFAAGLGAAELMTTYLGVQLGFYAALRDDPATCGQLAERTGVPARYAREWLEQQAACGILTVARTSTDAEQRAFELPAGHAEALLDSESEFAVTPLVVLPIGGISGALSMLVDAYRKGEGIPYHAYGADMRGGRDGLNKQIFLGKLPSWLARATPELHAELSTGNTRIADVACGSGWSTISLARTYPNADVHGHDLDEASILDARKNAAESGCGERVSFHASDAATLTGGYDLVCVFDSLHDMSRPVEVLSAARNALRDKGCMLLLEPKVGAAFQAPAPDTERFHYAVSVLHCLPVGMSDRPTAATGTVMRPGTVRRYARQAGFRRVDVLDVDHALHRLYRLTP